MARKKKDTSSETEKTPPMPKVEPAKKDGTIAVVYELGENEFLAAYDNSTRSVAKVVAVGGKTKVKIGDSVAVSSRKLTGNMILVMKDV